MAIESSGAKPQKEAKKGVTLKKFSNKEITMIFALVIVAIAALGAYFVLFPMFTNLATLSLEIDRTKAQELEHRNQIAQLETFQEIYDEARADYLKYISYFYVPMVPEHIDERITGLLIENEMTPATLVMTLLGVEPIPPYMAEELRVSPVPIPIVDEEEDEKTEDADSEAEDAEADAAAEPDEAADTEEEEDEYFAFVYTVTVGAYGDRENLFSFLAQTAPMTSMEITFFGYGDAINTREVTKPGEITMEIKLYVYVEGVAAANQEE